jgi:hypothetical protein
MKAQFWSFDIIFAIIIFLSAIILLSYIWLTISNEISTGSVYSVGEMQIQEQDLSSKLLSTGYPENWYSLINATNVQTWNNMSIGVGTGQFNTVSYQKFLVLMAMSDYNYTTYQETKSMLGITFNYYITISNNNMNMKIGLNPQSYSASSVQVATKNIYINGQQAQMKILLWTNSSSGIV